MCKTVRLHLKEAPLQHTALFEKEAEELEVDSSHDLRELNLAVMLGRDHMRGSSLAKGFKNREIKVCFKKCKQYAQKEEQ